MGAADLETPLLLIAMPQVLDPFFHRSVVLLLAHSDEGSLGFIVNRTTDIRVADILTGMEITWQGDQGARAFFGGPVQPQQGTMLFASEERFREGAEDPTATAVLPGVGVSQHLDDLAEIAADPPSRFRLFLGYAGWAEGQLVSEILRNDWLTAPVDVELLFHDAVAETWTRALESVGVDPTTLPAWTLDGGASGAN